jgi:hypothetical protein
MLLSLDQITAGSPFSVIVHARCRAKPGAEYRKGDFNLHKVNITTRIAKL